MNAFARILSIFFLIVNISHLGYSRPPIFADSDKGRQSKSSPKAVFQQIEDRKLQDFCKKWYGTKYQYGGCSTSGIDCSCFARTLYKSVYGTELERSSRSQYKQAKRVRKVRRLKEGDLVFFKIRSFRVNHVGIYIGDNKFIHASTSSGVIVSSLDEEFYRDTFHRGGKRDR